MNDLEFHPSGNAEEKNEGGSLTKTEKYDVVLEASKLLDSWSKTIPNPELESLIKQQLLKNTNEKKNDLYSYFFLETIERLIEKFKLSEKVPERARKYMEEAKSELFIPGSGMEEELEKLRKAA